MERNQHVQIKKEPHVPIIDLSNPDEELVGRAVAKACEEWGIFLMVNHGIPTDLIRRLQEVGREFFELPETEKKAVEKPEDSKDVEGYKTNYKSPKGDAWADHLFHRVWPPSRVNYRFWPKNPPEYKEVNEEYAREIKKLSEKIMEWLSKGLGLRPEALKEALGGEKVEYMMKAIYYPPCPNLDMVLGAPNHTDVSAITFLVANEVQGLQAMKDNNWIDANYSNSDIIVVVGDQFQRMSNGRYKSVVHRAIMDKEKTRMSWPVFVESNIDHVFGPLPELISSDGNAPKYKTCAFGDYKFRKINKLPLD